MATTAQQIVDACDAAILAIVQGKQSSATVNGITYTRLNLDELRRTRDSFQESVNAAALTSEATTAPFSSLVSFE